MADDLLKRLAAVSAAVEEAAAADGRPGGVRLLLATKTVPPPRILTALAAGYRLIGENRVQEVVAKARALAAQPHETHFIGRLQSNKINALLPLVDCIQTLDSAELGRRLEKRLQAAGRTLDVLVQANVSGEASKAGVPVPGLPTLLAQLAEVERITVRGYFTIGSNSSDPDQVRAGFRALADFARQAREGGLPGAEHADQLSMGMSGDYRLAIEEGATIVRIGSAAFGARPPLTGFRPG